MVMPNESGVTCKTYNVQGNWGKHSVRCSSQYSGHYHKKHHDM